MKLKYIIIVFFILCSIIGISFAADENNTTDEPVTAAAGKGTITELTAVGSPYSTAGAIQFRCVTKNTGGGNIPWGTCTLTIRYGPNNEYVKSITYNTGSLSSGESYTYLWNTTNVDFPYNSFQTGGSYITTATWNYPSGPSTRSTSFYSVPSPWIPLVIVAILIGFGSVYNYKRKKKD